jgi:hypothetical protein
MLIQFGKREKGCEIMIMDMWRRRIKLGSCMSGWNKSKNNKSFTDFSRPFFDRKCTVSFSNFVEASKNNLHFLRMVSCHLGSVCRYGKNKFMILSRSPFPFAASISHTKLSRRETAT